MDISNVTTAALKSVIKLTEKREALLSELAKVESAIASVYSGKAAKPAKPVAARRGRPAKAPRSVKATRAKSTGRRGALKDSIIAALQGAGDKGVSVKDLSKNLGVKNQNVHVWFSSTGRKLGNIQKIGSGKYRWKA